MLVAARNQAADQSYFPVQPACRQQGDRFGWIGRHVGPNVPTAPPPLYPKRTLRRRDTQRRSDGRGKTWLASGRMHRHMVPHRVVEPVARQVRVACSHPSRKPARNRL